VLFGLFAGLWWTLWLACAMVPESLVTTLYLMIKERRQGKVFWYAPVIFSAVLQEGRWPPGPA
jgi:hypothetical protein